VATGGLSLNWRRIPARYRLVGSHCETCGENFFPARNVCPNCRRKGNMKEKRFSGKGKVFTFTNVTAPPTGFELQAPYYMAIVELEEGPKLTTQLVDVNGKAVKIGDSVEVVFRKIQEDGKEGPIFYGYKFRLTGQ